MIIAIVGNIGAGKTTFCEYFSKKYNFEKIIEKIDDNPYLSLFYENKIDSFRCQLAFLTRFFETNLYLKNTYSNIIIDRTIQETAEVFEYTLWKEGKISNIDHSEYLRLYNAILKTIIKPNVIIYLKSSTNRCIKNIISRGRKYEQNINKEYIENLNIRYDEWTKNLMNYYKYFEINTDKQNTKEEAEKIYNTLVI